MRDPILGDVELPKGFRLTKPRLAVLKKFGQAMLARSEIYSYKPHNPTGRTLYGVSMSSQSEFAALRVMVHNGMIGPVGSDWQGTPRNHWRKTTIAVKPPFDQVARRLAAQEALLEERRNALMAENDAPYNEYRELKNELWQLVCEDFKTKDLLELAGRTQAARAAMEREEARVEAAKEAAKALPMPTLDEALAWLVARELKPREEDT